MYKFLQSLLIFIFTCIESATKSQTAYLTYFGLCYAFALGAWIILKKCFTFRTKEEVEQMRTEYSKLESYADVKVEENGPVHQKMKDTTMTAKTANFGGSGLAHHHL